MLSKQSVDLLSDPLTGPLMSSFTPCGPAHQAPTPAIYCFSTELPILDMTNSCTAFPDFSIIPLIEPLIDSCSHPVEFSIECPIHSLAHLLLEHCPSLTRPSLIREASFPVGRFPLTLNCHPQTQQHLSVTDNPSDSTPIYSPGEALLSPKTTKPRSSVIHGVVHSFLHCPFLDPPIAPRRWPLFTDSYPFSYCHSLNFHGPLINSGYPTTLPWMPPLNPILTPHRAPSSPPTKSSYDP